MEMLACDGCGKVTRNKNAYYGFLLTYPSYKFVDNHKWHLCPSCYKKFTKFMEADTEETEK